MTVTTIWVFGAIIVAVAIVLEIVVLYALYRALYEFASRREASDGWLEQTTLLILITIQVTE